jgi:hypothetical protein
MRRFAFIATLLIATSSVAFAAEEADSCEAILKRVMPTAIRMNYLEFDQSPNGWRQLTNCPAEAALLLKRYMKRLDHEMQGVRWHLAQTLAMSGDSKGAIEAALLSLNPSELEKRATFSWNSYVQATVEFLRNDRQAFDVQLEVQRKAAAANPENQMNLDVLTRMARCFGQPYKVAYVCSVAP